MKKTKYDIFISYRRDNGADTAKHLRDVLVSKGYSVFFDTDSLRSGVFNQELINVIKNCKDFILILSPNSLDRCVNDGDWVRQEIACALNSNKNIIPVLSSKFSFPDELPSDIDNVRWRSGVTVNIEYFDAMVEKLLTFLQSKPKKKVIIRSLLSLVLVCSLLAIAFLIYRSIRQKNTQKDNDSALSVAYVQQITNEGLVALDSGDYLTALQRLRVAAEEGDHVALCNLGYMYSNGLGVELSHEKAFELYQKAMEQGDITAITNIGLAYANGLGVEQSYDKAIEYYLIAFEKGDIAATSYLGYMYDNGLGVDQSHEKAAEYFLLAADSGDKLAQAGLAYLYENGLGVEKSHEKALYYYNLSKSQEGSSKDETPNNEETPNNTEELSEEYVKQLVKDGNEAYNTGNYKKALQNFLKAAEQGNTSAHNKLGYMYAHGEGVEQSYEKAFNYYQMAAEQGDASAQNSIGYFYDNGLGVEQSYEKAAEYYKLAADQGLSSAQSNLGFMYEKGYGVEQSYEKAAEYFQKAAEQGNYTALYSMGYYYEYGYGVEQSYEKAVENYKLAAEKGYKPAQEKYDELIQKGSLQPIAKSDTSDIDNKKSNNVKNYSLDAVSEYCEAWTQYYQKKSENLFISYAMDSEGQLSGIVALYNDDENNDGVFPSIYGTAFSYDPNEYCFTILISSYNMEYDIKNIKFQSINLEIKKDEITNSHGETYYFKLRGEDVYKLYSKGAFTMVLTDENNSEESIKISKKDNKILYDMIMLIMQGSWYAEEGNQNYLDKELLPKEMENDAAEDMSNNETQNAEKKEKKNNSNTESYLFKEDYDAIAETAQSLFYVEMYDASSEWLGTASGFVSFDEHVFITNQHVIDGSSYLKIWDEKDKMYVLDKVIASDKTRDIAILMFEDGSKYTSLKQHTELNLKRGEPVMTIGSPRGLQGTVDVGVVSGFPVMKQYGNLKCIQFSAAISPGSSGGALFDNEGYVIGITSSSMDDSQNLNFAIPITEVQKIYAQWDKKSYVILGSKQSWDTEGLQ